MKKYLKITVIIVAVLAGIVYVLNKNKSENDAQTAIVAQSNSSVAVRTEKAETRELNAQYVANSSFVPKQEVKLSSEISGKVTRVLVEEGSYVRPGQTLAIINGDKQNVTVTNAQAVYNNAQAEVARFESAYASGGVTKQQLDQIKLQLENAKNNLRASQLGASDTNIKASFSGIVNSKNVESGLVVSPGQELFEIVDVSSLKLKVNVDEKNIGGLKVGQKVKVVAQVLSGQTFEGTISFIAPKADASLNFPVEIEIKNNASKDLKAGMYGSAYFGNDQKVPVLSVPRSAFVGSVSSGQVFVVKDGKAVLTKVNAGKSYGDYIEITSGINAGDEVVTSGQINLTDGSAIRVIK
jgi:membrane fusion protein (multidrug efflux system)